MIKPTDIAATTTATTGMDPLRLQSIEQQFDAAITRAQQSGVWPAVVPSFRDGAMVIEIAYVATRYVAEGWLVSVGEGGCRAKIRLPIQEQAGGIQLL